MVDNEETHLSAEDARGGATPHMTRVILPVSLGLIVVLFLILLFVWR